jgi:hypothetical protein
MWEIKTYSITAYILCSSVDNDHVKLIIQFEGPFVIKRLYTLLFQLAIFAHFLISNFGTILNVIVFCDNFIQRTSTCISERNYVNLLYNLNCIKLNKCSAIMKEIPTFKANFLLLRLVAPWKAIMWEFISEFASRIGHQLCFDLLNIQKGFCNAIKPLDSLWIILRLFISFI